MSVRGWSWVNESSDKAPAGSIRDWVVTVWLHQKKERGRSSDQPLNFLVGRVGIEPTTNGLRVRCSTS